MLKFSKFTFWNLTIKQMNCIEDVWIRRKKKLQILNKMWNLEILFHW